jgi:hypothetical protein
LISAEPPKAKVDDQKEDAVDFEKEEDTAKDPDVRTFAEKTLLTLQSYLSNIEKIQAAH